MKAVFCPVKLKWVHCERDGLCETALFADASSDVVRLYPVRSKALDSALNR